MWMGGEQKPQRDRKRQKLIVTWKERRPAETLPTHLNNLFQTLAAAMPLKDAYEVEDLIWEAWTECRDPAAAAAMRQEIAGIAKQEYEEAETVLNTLIQAQPRWAEVWNKRATLFFLQGRDAESIQDINRTLELEPRHFGAISSFAQICLRNNDYDSALIALETALSINPHLAAVRATIEVLKRKSRPSMH